MVDSVLLDALLPLIGPDRVHVFAFQRGADHFPPDRETEGQAEAALLRAGATCRQPVLFLARGITADGRMLFLAFADRALATTEATFGFPSVRRGAATLATAALRKRAPLQRIRRWIFIGEMFEVATARSSGLVESILMRDTMRREIDHVVVDCARKAALNPATASVPEIRLAKAELEFAIADVAPGKIGLVRCAPGIATMVLPDPRESPRTRNMRVRETAREASSRSDLHALVVLSLARDHIKARFQSADFEWRHSVSAVAVPTVGVATGALTPVVLATDWRTCSALASYNHADRLEARAHAREARQMLAAALVCAVHERISAAIDHALTLVNTIVSAPSVGLRNTVGLLRSRSTRVRSCSRRSCCARFLHSATTT